MRTAVLNSRQTKTPVFNDDWVLNTIAATVHSAEINEWNVVSSIGMLTWDLVTWQTGEVGGNLELVVPRPRSDDTEQFKNGILRDFDLDSSHVRWHFVDAPAAETKAKSWWAERDRRVVELADTLLPVSVRPYGVLNRLLCSPACKGIIDRQFQIPYKPTPHHVRQLIDPSRVNPQIHNWPDDYLIHWTRTCHGPWPGETRASFFEDLVRSEGNYCRSAALTLKRILEEKRIRASSWRIAGYQPVVAFTELSPVESLPLMRWRARWARWSFEPYGIVVHRDWAASQGVRPVKYVTEKEWRNLSPEERPFCHRIGAKSGEWPAEREWRCLGDFDLCNAAADAVHVLIRSDAEAHAIRHCWDGALSALTCDSPT